MAGRGLTSVMGRIERVVHAIKAKYDVVSDKHTRKRRRPEIETESDTDILDDRRAEAINMCRDLERNFTGAKSHLRQFRVSAVGADGPKLNILASGKNGKEAARWFNAIYSKECDFCDDMPFAEMVANVLVALKREGDVLVVFDDFIEDTGKLLFFEADQLVELSKAVWDQQKQFDPEQYSQKSGVIIDHWGRVVGYIVSHTRGQRLQTKLEDVLIVTTKSAKLVKNSWKFNERRGAADLLNPSAMYQDTYEMFSKELQSAKVASSIAGKVRQQDEDIIDDLLQAGYTPSDILEDATASIQDGEAQQPVNYDRYEALTGGYIEYMEGKDDFELFKIDRPNVHMPEFVDRTNSMAGASLGLGKSYATMSPAGNYTAFRGDMLLTWAQFYWDQKVLERRCCDWIAYKAITWAIRKGIIQPLKDFKYRLKWTWPKMPQVDTLRDENAISAKLENKTIDYFELLGPNWEDKLKSLAEQQKFIKELFGAVTPVPDDQGDDDAESDN